MNIFTIETSKMPHCHFFLTLYININSTSFVENSKNIIFATQIKQFLQTI